MTKRHKEAITEFKRAIQASAHYLECHVSMACTYSLMDRGNDAEAAASEVIKIDPEFSVQNYAKTLPYKEKGDLNCVIDALRKAGLK